MLGVTLSVNCWQLGRHQRIRAMIVVGAKHFGVTHRTKMNRPRTDHTELRASPLLNNRQRNRLHIVAEAPITAHR